MTYTVTDTAFAIALTLDIHIALIPDINRRDNTITLTHAQARRLLALARKGQEVTR